MKKLLNTAFIYAIAAMAGGVFFREFTKFSGFTGKTNLSFLHTHLFVLGMLFFLVLLCMEKNFKLTKEPLFGKFFGLYNTGMAITVAGMFTRGMVQVAGSVPSRAFDAAISGVSGIGHILLGIGIIVFFVLLKKRTRKSNSAS